MQTRMARYDIHNDGSGPYAVFYCDKCSRQFRSRPDTKATIAKEIARSAFSGLFRSVPVLGETVDNIASSNDPRSSTTLSTQQLSGAWAEVQPALHQCPVCLHFVCPTDWNAEASICNEDAAREQGAATATEDAASAARCSNCGADVRNAKFCRECGTPVATKCRSCGADIGAAKFCPECGAKQAGE